MAGPIYTDDTAPGAPTAPTLDASIFLAAQKKPRPDSLNPDIDYDKLVVASGQPLAPELPKVAPQILSPTGLGTPSSVGTPVGMKAKLLAEIERRVDENKTLDAKATQWNPIFRSYRQEAANRGRQQLADLLRTYEAVTQMENREALTPATAARLTAEAEAEKARAGLNTAQAAYWQKKPLAPPKESVDTSGRVHYTMFSPEGPQTYDSGVTTNPDIRKMERGGFVINTDPDTGEVTVEDRRGAAFSGGSSFNRTTGKVIDRKPDASGKKEDPAFTAKRKAAEADLAAAQRELARAQNMASRKWATPADKDAVLVAQNKVRKATRNRDAIIASVQPEAAPAQAPAGKKVIGRFNPATGQIE